MQFVSFICQLWGTAISTCRIGGWVGPRTSVDNLKNIKSLSLPGTEPWTVQPIAKPQLTNLFQLFSKNMKVVPKTQWYWSSTNSLYFTRVMINIKHASQTGNLLLYDLKSIANFISYPEETGSRFLWNTGNEIPQWAVSLPRTQQSSRNSLFSRHQNFMIYSQSIINNIIITTTATATVYAAAAAAAATTTTTTTTTTIISLALVLDTPVSQIMLIYFNWHIQNPAF